MTSTRLMPSFIALLFTDQKKPMSEVQVSLQVSLKDTDGSGTLAVIQTPRGNGFVALMHN